MEVELLMHSTLSVAASVYANKGRSSSKVYWFHFAAICYNLPCIFSQGLDNTNAAVGNEIHFWNSKVVLPTAVSLIQ